MSHPNHTHTPTASRRQLDPSRRPEVRRDAAGLERMLFRVTAPEVRAAGDGAEGSPGHFTGHAAVWNTRSVNLGAPWFTYREIVRRGAFTKTLQEADVRFVINHDPNLILARRRGADADTLDLEEDDVGLLVNADLPATTYSRDAAISLRRGDVDQMSFAFMTVRDEWFEEEDGTITRDLLEVKLRDVSLVTYPAYLETDAAVRSAQLDSLVRALGLDSLGVPERSAAIFALGEGTADADMVRDIADRIARRADTTSRATEPAAPPAPDPVDLERWALRHRGNAARFGVERATQE